MCCAEGGSRCPDRSLGPGWMEGRGGVAGWGAGGHLREKKPPSTSRGWKQAGGQDPPHPSNFLESGAHSSSPGSEEGEASSLEPSLPLLRAVCHSAGGQLAAEKLVWGGWCLLWGRVALEPRVPLTQAPLGPLL